MPSYRITVSPKRKAASRAVSLVRSKLQRALVEEKARQGLTQAEIARRLDVHRSVISRELKGEMNIGVGRLGELAWAMGRRLAIDLALDEPSELINKRDVQAEATTRTADMPTISGPNLYQPRIVTRVA